MSSSIRTFNPDQDFDVYLAFYNALSDTPTNEQEQRDYAEMLTIDLNQDRFLAEAEGEVIGVLDMWRIATNPSADMYLQVHPEWRRQGIGTRLLRRGLEHAQVINATAVDAYAQENQVVERAFLEHHGFSVAGNYTGMELTLDKPLPPAELSGYTLKTYAELEMSAKEKLELIFKSSQEFDGILYGHKVFTDEDLGKQRFKELILPNHPEDAMFFLFEGEEFIGHDRVSFGEIGENKVGYAGVPAMHPQYYTPELVRNFALVGLEWLYKQGCRQLAFSAYGESEATLDAFKALGFAVTLFELGYRLELS